MTRSFVLRVLALASATPAVASEVAVLPLRASGLHEMLLAEVGLLALYIAVLLAILCLPRRKPTARAPQ